MTVKTLKRWSLKKRSRGAEVNRKKGERAGGLLRSSAPFLLRFSEYPQNSLHVQTLADMGAASRRARVYGCSGRSRTRSVGPSSTNSPLRMTATPSQTSLTTSRSCEIHTRASSLTRRSRDIKSRICACTETSREEVGSSRISSCGLDASARAIAMRCRSPPENSLGYFSADADGSPTWSSSSATRCRRCDASPME